MKIARAFAFALSALSLGACVSAPDFSQMTPEQIYAYQANQAYQMQQLQAITAQSQAFAAQMQNQSNQLLQQSQSYTPPAVGSYTQPGSNYVYCRSLGTYVIHCND